MHNVEIAFEILGEKVDAPKGWKRASGHLVFDVKMDFTRKARYVLDGHKTETPEISTYAGVVSKESIRIALTYAALNGLDVCAADIQNAYLQAPTTERHYIICGDEFGLENVGKRALIRRALYGGKSAGADYWRHVRKAMDEMNFQSCKADPDVWFRASGLENIVSLALLKQVATVSFDSSKESAFLATFRNGHVWRFSQTENGLFIYEHVHTDKFTNENVLDYCLISTVEANEKQFHRREVEGAIKAGKFYRHWWLVHQDNLLFIVFSSRKT